MGKVGPRAIEVAAFAFRFQVGAPVFGFWVGALAFMRGERLSSLAMRASFLFPGFSRGVSVWEVPGLKPKSYYVIASLQR